VTGLDLYAFDHAVRRRTGRSLVCGVDEVGRGCLAGPLVAAAVVLGAQTRFSGKLRDSKLLTPRCREQLFVEIVRSAPALGVSIVSVTYINRHGIARANEFALMAAAESACRTYGDVPILVDGLPLRHWKREHEAIVHGDRRSAAIAAASIIAKVLRDRLMRVYDRWVPCYGFARHVGYSTPGHRAAIQMFGASEFHRYYAHKA